MTNPCRSSNDEDGPCCRSLGFLLGVVIPSSFLVLVSSFSFLLCGCKKAAAPKAKAEPPVVVRPTLLTEAASLGLAGRVVGDVEFCISSVGLKKHAEALKASRWWNQMAAFVEDKAPAAAANGRLTVDEVFIAFGKDSVKSLGLLRQLNDLYNETAYRGMMSGGILAGLGSSFDAQKLWDAALTDPQVLEALILLLERFEMPPVMIGIASSEPEQVLKLAGDVLSLSDWLGEAPQSRIVTTQGEQLTVNEVAMDQILTTEKRRLWLEKLMKGMPQIKPEIKDRISRGLEVLAGKKWVLALGLGKERAYVGVGSSKDQIRLANSVEDSLLARTELRFADDLVSKNLGVIACWDGSFLDVLQSDQPFQPMLRGLLAGLQSETMFAGMARALAPQLVELAAAERACYAREHTNGAAVAWWADGLQAEFIGGMTKAETQTLAQVSQFGALLDDPEVVFGLSGHGSTDGTGRAYFEAWMKTVYLTAHELAKAGVGGEQAVTTFKLVDQAVLPGVLRLYDGTKTIWQKALGSDGAFILDTGGKMPLLPGLPPGGEEVPLPRIALVHEITNRALMSVSWQNMDEALQQLLQQVPAPQPIELPPVKTKHSGEITSHLYELPFGSDDLVPCVSLTDKLFMLGTSRRQQNEIATRLKQPGMPVVGKRMKISFAKLREFLKTFARVRSQNGEADSLKTAQRWLEPFEMLDVHLWSKEGQAKGSLSWKIHDVLSYD